MNNVCPQCKTPDVLNWHHDWVTDRFICVSCSYTNFERGHAVEHQRLAIEHRRKLRESKP